MPKEIEPCICGSLDHKNHPTGGGLSKAKNKKHWLDVVHDQYVADKQIPDGPSVVKPSKKKCGAASKYKRWTVFGYYPDNNERSARWVQAPTADEAEAKTIRGMKRRNQAYVVVAVGKGQIWREESADEITNV